MTKKADDQKQYAAQGKAESKSSVTGNVTGNKKSAKPQAIDKRQHTLFDGPAVDVEVKHVEPIVETSTGGSNGKFADVQDFPKSRKPAPPKSSVRPETRTDNFMMDAHLENTPQPDGTIRISGKVSLQKDDDKKTSGSQRAAKCRDSKKAEGKVRLELWTYPELKEEITDYMVKLMDEYEANNGEKCN